MVDHSERAHAELSPSSISRIKKCPSSVVYSETVPERTSEFAEEGTLGHEIAELYSKKTFQIPLTPEENQALDDKKYDNQMRDYAKQYADFLFEKCGKFRPSSVAGKLVVEFEKRLHFSERIWGTVDFIAVKEVKPDVFDLLLVDYKYGQGVEVSAEDNAQLKTYTACAVEELLKPYGKKLRKAYCYIFQPRTPGEAYSRDVHTGDDIAAWAKELDEIAKAVDKAYEHPEKMVNASGVEHCRFCNYRPYCKAFLKESNEKALIHMDAEEPSVPPVESLSLEQRETILLHKKAIEQYLKDVEHSLMEDATNGVQLKNFKVVAGQSRRVWIDDETAVHDLLKELGCKRAYRRSLITLGEAEKQLEGSKKEKAEMLSSVTTKTVPKRQLVVMDDKRPAIEFLSDADKLKALDSE